MKVWTFAWDDKNGTGCSVHMTEKEQLLAFIQHVTEEGSEEETEAKRILEADEDGLWDYLEENCFEHLATYGLEQDTLPDPFTGDELATILHGLRIIQEIRKQVQLPEAGAYGCIGWERRLAHYGGDVNRAIVGNPPYFSCDHFVPDWNPLTDAEIDALCERINPLTPDDFTADSGQTPEAA